MRDINCMTHNVKKDLHNASLRRQAGDVALQNARQGIGVLNEINADDVPFLKSCLQKYELRWVRKGEMAIVWDPAVIRKHAWTWREISPGGYIGADGTKAGPDNRRVGPPRIAIKFKGYVISDNTPIQAIGIHKIAKAFTEHKWRQRIWWRSTRNTSRFIRRSLKRFPNGFIVGDENAPFPVNYPGLDEVSVPAPATFGKLHYDQIKVFGALKAITVREFKTPSDHDGLAWRLRKTHIKVR